MDGEQITGDAAQSANADGAAQIESGAGAASTEPPKKRRGRPPGSGAKTAEQIEAGGDAKAAAKPAARKGKVSFDKSQLEVMGKQLVGAHKLAVMVTGIPELEISDQEGVLLAGGIAGVCEQYGLELDGKTGATLQLVLTAAMVYGPRALALRARAAQAAANDASRTVPAAS